MLKHFGIGKEDLNIKFEMIDKKVILTFD